MTTASLPLPPVPGPRFDHLVASVGGYHRSWNPRSLLISVIAHVTLLGGALFVSLPPPAPQSYQPAKKQEDVTYFNIQKPPAPPPPALLEKPLPPPPPVVPRRSRATQLAEAPVPTETPPPLEGYQTIVPPADPPPVVPDVDWRVQPVIPEDFSGVGQAGGTSTGVADGTPTNTAPKDTTPVFAVEEIGMKPQIRNLHEIMRLLERNFPRKYVNAGISGQVQVRFMIDEEGKVPAGSITVIVATNDDFAEAALKAVERIRFRPIKYRGNSVRVWATMPITFLAPH